MPNILITGCSGYLGRNLIKNLPSEYNLFLNSRSPSSADKGENIVCKISELSSKLESKQIDIIIHLAYRIENSEEAYEESLQNMKHIVELAKKHNSHLIFSSSCAVYGNAPLPHSETSPFQPINRYGESKRDCEELIKKELDDHTILRIFNLYGGDQSENFVIPSLIKKIKKGNSPVTIMSSENIRDFVHVNFAVKCILFFIKNKSKGVFNIGSGEATKIFELAEKIKKVTGSNAELISDKKGGSESLADMSKLEGLGLKYDLEFEEGLKQVISSLS